MNKILKKFSTLALVGLIGLQTTNVFAAEKCEPEKVRYAYYMFMGIDTVDKLNSKIDSKEKYESFNSAKKTNDIQTNEVLAKRQIKIITNDPSTASSAGGGEISSGTSSELGTIEKDSCNPGDGGICADWTPEDFWYYYLKSINKDASDYTDSRNLVDLSKSHWYYHKGYTTYETREHKGGTFEDNPKKFGSLDQYFVDNKYKIQDIAQNGTFIPKATDHLPLPDMNKNVEGEFVFYVNRTWLNGDETEHIAQTGIKLPGTNGGKNVVYTPSVYVVQYCLEAQLLRFNANTTDTVIGTPEPISFNDFTSIPSIENEPSREGYIFKGWDTQADGNGTRYHKGDKFESKEDETVLYAIWEKAPEDDVKKGPFTVTYDANGGKDAPTAQKSEDGTCITISDGQPTQGKVKFLGWSTNKGAGEPDEKYSAGKEYCGEDGDITLYAVWANSKTGISAHAIAFGGAILTAGIALYIAKKRDLLKQI